MLWHILCMALWICKIVVVISNIWSHVSDIAVNICVSPSSPVFNDKNVSLFAQDVIQSLAVKSQKYNREHRIYNITEFLWYFISVYISIICIICMLQFTHPSMIFTLNNNVDIPVWSLARLFVHFLQNQYFLKAQCVWGLSVLFSNWSTAVHCIANDTLPWDIVTCAISMEPHDIRRLLYAEILQLQILNQFNHHEVHIIDPYRGTWKVISKAKQTTKK